MPIFKPKVGPVFSRSRLWHFALASALTAGGGHFWGYEGAVFGGAGIIVIGFAWEVLNRWLPGYHPYGDAIDFYSFVVGALIANIGVLLTA